MYAIINEGGRQHKVEEGQELNIDLSDAHSGDEIIFDQVLAIRGDSETKLGQPFIDGAKVTAEVVGVARGEKIVVQKFRRRKNSRRKQGHRQLYTTVRVHSINAG